MFDSLTLWLVLALLLVLAGGVLFSPWLVPHALQFAIRWAERRLETGPAMARRACAMASRILEWLARRRPLSRKGADALAWAQILLAILDSQEGQAPTGLTRLEKVRSLIREGPDQRRWLLKYYLATSRRSAEAVQCYLTFIQDEKGGSPAQRSKVLQALQAACEVRPGLDQADLTERVKWNREAQKAFPQESWPLVNEGQAWRLLGRTDRARRAFDTVLSQHPDDWRAQAFLARILAAEGDTTKARDALTVLEQQHPTDSEVLLEVASQLAGLQCFKEANELLSRLTKLDEGAEAQVLALKGHIFTKFGQPEKAIAPLEKGFAKHPGDRRIGLALAESLSAAGEHARALQVLRQVIPADTTDPELQFSLGCGMFNAGEFEGAATWLEKCGRVNFQPRQAPLLRARALLQRGDHAAAFQVLRELEDIGEEPPEMAFYRGVAQFKSGSARTALPHFMRAHNQTLKTGDQALNRRTKVNLMACYLQIGNEQIRAGQFPLAAATFDALRKTMRPNHPNYSVITQTLSECYLRPCAQLLASGDAEDRLEAIASLERAVELGARPLVRMLLAGLYCKVNRHAEGVALYDALLLEAPGDQTLLFARALAASRTADPATGLLALRQILDQGGRYAMRAAVALASQAAEETEFDRAVELLLTATRLPNARQNRYYGEAACKAVLYSLRADNEAQARQLAGELLGEAKENVADVIIGSLLADQGDYERALGYLNAAVPSDGKRSLPARLRNQVYRRLAFEHCEKKDFAAAVRLLERALEHDKAPELHQFHRLAKVARKAGESSQRLDDQVVMLLEELHSGVSDPDALLVRSLMVAYHRRAYDLTRAGKDKSAHSLWDRAHKMWNDRMQGRRSFWSEYIGYYNQGQQYRLEANVGELDQRISRQLAGLCVVFCGQFMEGRTISEDASAQEEEPAPAQDDGTYRFQEALVAPRIQGKPQFDQALYFWEQAKELEKQEVLVGLFKEVVNVDAIARRIDAGKNPDQAYVLYRFLYENIAKTEEYRSLAANSAVKQALDALENENVGSFLRRFDAAGEVDADYAAMAIKLRSLGKTMISRVVTTLLSRSDIRDLRDSRPDLIPMILFRVVMIVANSIDNIDPDALLYGLDMFVQEALRIAVNDLAGK